MPYSMATIKYYIHTRCVRSVRNRVLSSERLLLLTMVMLLDGRQYRTEDEIAIDWLIIDSHVTCCLGHRRELNSSRVTVKLLTVYFLYPSTEFTCWVYNTQQISLHLSAVGPT